MSFPIRDAHTHFFSHTFFTTLASQAGGDVDATLRRLSDERGIELPPTDDSRHLMRWIDAMDRASVESMVTFASLPEEADNVANVCLESGGRLCGLVVQNPIAPGAVERLTQALDQGLRGLVLFPAMHGYDIADDRCAPVLEKLRDAGGVCVVHTGVLQISLRDALGLPRNYDGRFANPLSLVRPASKFPELPFVIPHFGGGMLRETLLAGSWCPNILVDSSSSNGWMKTQLPMPTLDEVFARTIDVLGVDRILFGTDSSVFPRGYRADLLQLQLDATDTLGLTDDDKAAIFGGNWERLFGNAD